MIPKKEGGIMTTSNQKVNLNECVVKQLFEAFVSQTHWKLRPKLDIDLNPDNPSPVDSEELLEGRRQAHRLTAPGQRRRRVRLSYSFKPERAPIYMCLGD